MKRNLMTMIVMILVVVNIVLTGLLFFSVMPQAQKQNELITKVASAIDLELADTNTEESSELSIDQLETYDISDQLTINLKKGADGAEHFAVVSVSLAMNTQDKDYETYSGQVSAKESLIKNEIISTLSAHTIDELKNKTTEIQQELLENIQALFNSKFIAQVAFRDVVYQ